MPLNDNKNYKLQTGFSLVEILVGLVIGLLATLVIMQVFSVFEGQKRTTMGSADAQTNGSYALFNIQRDVQMAGFGLPVFDTQNPPLKCTTSPLTVDHDGNAATPEVGMFPISITDGGAGASDGLVIRYSIDGAVSKGGISTKIISLAGTTAGVDNNLGCNNGDVVMISAGTACALTKVIDADLAIDTTHITLQSAVGASINASLACMGRWNQFEYSVANNQLQRLDALNVTPTPIVSDVVNMQAQYGVSDNATNNQVTRWVNASGATWGVAMTVADRNRIKAVRVAIVARNGLQEKANVDGSTVCSSLTSTGPTGICAWAGTANSPAPVIDLSNDANWQKYRYRVYETIIPIRNMIWSKNTL
jgi:type IV pilus assembly protein PilW